MDDPRRHHYSFAHRSLPEVARRMGPEMVAAGRAGALVGGLTRHWESLGRHLHPEDRLSGEGLSALVFDAPEYDVVVVRFPAPRAVTEAHLAAICVPRGAAADGGDGPGGGGGGPDGGGPDGGAAAGVAVRYLTLEYSVHPIHGATYTVLGEWTADGTHVNYGEGPPADDLAGFVAVVTRRLTGAD